MSVCGTCGSQDTTFKQGISKASGKPWKAYDCNEPQCKNDKGYPSRTFVFTPKPKGSASAPQNTPRSPQTQGNGTLEAKIDQILRILKANFPEQETHVPDEESTPF